MKPSLFFITFFSCLIANAQADRDISSFVPDNQEYKKHRIALNLGIASPVGDFGNSDILDEKSGFANGGSSFELNYTYFLDPNIGLGILWGGMGFIFAEEAYLREARLIVPNANFTLTADPYGVGYFFVGMRLQTTGRTKYYVNPGFGSMSMLVPKLVLQRTIPGDPDASGLITSSSSSSGALGYGIAGGADFYISEKFTFNVSLQYLKADFDIETLITFQSQTGNVEKLIGTYQQPFQSLNFNIGLAYNF